MRHESAQGVRRTSIASQMAHALKAHERAMAALLRNPDASDDEVTLAAGVDIGFVRRARQELQRKSYVEQRSTKSS